MSLSMEEWDRDVAHHLQMIEEGAEMCQRHAQRLVGMPEWETKAMDQLNRAGITLLGAARKLAETKTIMMLKDNVR